MMAVKPAALMVAISSTPICGDTLISSLIRFTSKVVSPWSPVACGRLYRRAAGPEATGRRTAASREVAGEPQQVEQPPRRALDRPRRQCVARGLGEGVQRLDD